MSEETLKLAREFMATRYPSGNIPDMWAETTVADFAEQVARECAEIAHMKSNNGCEKSCEYCEIARAIEERIRAKFGIPEQERMK